MNNSKEVCNDKCDATKELKYSASDIVDMQKYIRIKCKKRKYFELANSEKFSENTIYCIMKLIKNQPLTDHDKIMITRQIAYGNIYYSNSDFNCIVKKFIECMARSFTGVVFDIEYKNKYDHDHNDIMVFKNINTLYDAQMLSIFIIHDLVSVTCSFYLGMKITSKCPFNEKTHSDYEKTYNYNYGYIHGKYLNEYNDHKNICTIIKIYYHDELTIYFGDLQIKKLTYLDYLKYNSDIENIITELAEQRNIFNIQIIFNHKYPNTPFNQWEIHNKKNITTTITKSRAWHKVRCELEKQDKLNNNTDRNWFMEKYNWEIEYDKSNNINHY